MHAKKYSTRIFNSSPCLTVSDIDNNKNIYSSKTIAICSLHAHMPIHLKGTNLYAICLLLKPQTETKYEAPSPVLVSVFSSKVC